MGIIEIIVILWNNKYQELSIFSKKDIQIAIKRELIFNLTLNYLNFQNKYRLNLQILCLICLIKEELKKFQVTYIL